MPTILVFLVRLERKKKVAADVLQNLKKINIFFVFHIVPQFILQQSKTTRSDFKYCFSVKKIILLSTRTGISFHKKAWFT